MEFDEFWKMYPRKVARKDAMKAWNKLTPDQKRAAIENLPRHVAQWDDPNYTPHAATWLNGERWTDELPEKKSSADWMRTTSGIEMKARELGISAKPGEDWHSLKARILARAA